MKLNKEKPKKNQKKNKQLVQTLKDVRIPVEKHYIIECKALTATINSITSKVFFCIEYDINIQVELYYKNCCKYINNDTMMDPLLPYLGNTLSSFLSNIK